MGVVLNIEVALSDLEMVQPIFKRSCGKPTVRKVCSAVGSNEVRVFFRCDVGYVENSTSSVFEDPSWERHLACGVWIWADVLNRIARDVFEENQLSDADLRAKLLGIDIARAE
ncbi:hypothetical protein ACQ4PT_013841 [Festuca glaucescens]